MHLLRYNQKVLFYVVLSLVLVGATIVLLSPAPTIAASNTNLNIQDDPIPTPSEPTEDAAITATAPNCRYGVTASSTSASTMETMKIGWLLSFSASEQSWLPPNVAHTPMIRLKQNRGTDGNRLPSYTAQPALTQNGLGRLIQANPGAIWIVGNEVDRVFWQDDLMPDVYAMAYHDAYQFIKQNDPTAQVAISALVLVSPGRLQYLDLVLDAYKQKYRGPMPIDVWTFHAYLFAERYEEYNGEGGKPIYASVALGTDPAIAIKAPWPTRPISEQLELCKREDYACIYEHDSMEMFTKQVIDMRTWMKARGYQNRPLLLTEWSLLHGYTVSSDGQCNTRDENGNCFTPPRVTNFLEASLSYLENAINPSLGFPLDNNRLVQQWSWFPMDDLGGGQFTEGNPSFLIAPDSGALTQMGNKYQEFIQQSTTKPSLVIDTIHTDVVEFAPPGTGTAQLKVSIRNNGNTPTTVPFSVKFFSNANLTQEIGQVTVPAGLDGCAALPVLAELEWTDLDEGVHRYWVKVDSDNAVGPEKTGSALVFVNPEKIYLPAVER